MASASGSWVLLGTGEGTDYADGRLEGLPVRDGEVSMKKVVQARIDWTPPEYGGRKNILPIGMRYCPIIVFESEQSGSTLWSAEMYNTTINGRMSVADVSYLVDDAPYHLLQSGGKFLLYEGQRVVAQGVVS